MLGNSRRISAFAAAVLLAGGGLAVSAEAGGKTASVAFQRFKALAGEWTATEDTEMAKKGDLVARYTVTAAGSAVVETLFPGSQHEMVTVYNADGPDLVLTHYCMEGNQPRMRAKDPKGARVDFTYDGGTNIRPKSDRHMHSATFEFLGADEIRSEWTEVAEGKTVLVAKSHLVRKAR